MLLLPLSTLRRLTLARRIYRLAVFDRINEFRVQLQGLVVGRDGLVIAAGLGQRVALVVAGLDTGHLRVSLGCGGVISGAIGAITFAQDAMLLLVGAQPPAALLRRGLRKPRTRHHQTETHHSHHRGHTRLAPKCPQAEQHQDRQQPVAFVLPGQAMLATHRSGIVRRRRIKHTQCTQVGIIGGQDDSHAATGRRQLPQRTRIQPHAMQLAIAAARLAALGGTQAYRRHPVTGSCGLARGGDCLAIHAATQQDDVAPARAALLHQALRVFDGPRRPATVDRHDLRRQRIDEQFHIGGVVGQRRHRERILGIGDDADLTIGPQLEQLPQLGACLQQSRRRDVGGGDLTRQVDRDHQRTSVLPRWLRQLSPSRARQCQRRQQHTQEQNPGVARLAATVAAFKHVRAQMRVDVARPDILARPAPALPPPQQGQREEQPQPLLADEMDRPWHRVDAHRRLRSHANACASNAARQA